MVFEDIFQEKWKKLSKKIFEEIEKPVPYLIKNLIQCRCFIEEKRLKEEFIKWKKEKFN